MHADLLTDIGRCILVSMALAYVAHLARQPLILAYLGTGMLLGSHMGFGWLSNIESIQRTLLRAWPNGTAIWFN